jgi:hypothetical protein
VTDSAQADVLNILAGCVADRLADQAQRTERVALTRREAADSLGMSVDHFERHVLPDLRVIRSGRLVLVPVAELRRWADRAAALTLGGVP